MLYRAVWFRAQAFLLVSVFSTGAAAFVDNVTHGYPSCLACHMSPAGGGLLSDYGRSLSRELMSTWGWEKSESPAFGAVENKDWLKIGGDFRSLQSYYENADVRQKKLFIMQQNLELGVRVGKVWFIGTAGTLEGPKGTPHKGEFLSERHYLMWETAGDSRLRVGKFRLNFGLYDPNHTRVTESALGFGANSETYNLEYSKTWETEELSVTAVMGRLDIPRHSSSERALSASYARYLGSHAKAGTSLLIGESGERRRVLGGGYGVFRLSEKSLVKVELDYQQSQTTLEPHRNQDLFAGHTILGYSVMKGLTPYLLFEYLQRDLADKGTRQNAPGMGIQWLPIPHLELQAEYQRQTVENRPGKPNQIGWILAHFYL